MPNLGVPELLIIALVIFLLFGATRLPNAARSLGRSMRIFKSEVKEMRNDDEQPAACERGRGTHLPLLERPLSKGNSIVQRTPRSPSV